MRFGGRAEFQIDPGRFEHLAPDGEAGRDTPVDEPAEPVREAPEPAAPPSDGVRVAGGPLALLAAAVASGTLSGCSGAAGTRLATPPTAASAAPESGTATVQFRIVVRVVLRARCAARNTSRRPPSRRRSR